MSFHVPGKNGSNGINAKSASSLTAYLETCQSLVEFLSLLSVEGGGLRVPGTLTLTSNQGKWKGKLRCPNGVVYAWVTGDTVDDVLDALEKGLGSESGLDWRPDTFETNGRKK